MSATMCVCVCVCMYSGVLAWHPMTTLLARPMTVLREASETTVTSTPAEESTLACSRPSNLHYQMSNNGSHSRSLVVCCLRSVQRGCLSNKNMEFALSCRCQQKILDCLALPNGQYDFSIKKETAQQIQAHTHFGCFQGHGTLSVSWYFQDHLSAH